MYTVYLVKNEANKVSLYAQKLHTPCSITHSNAICRLEVGIVKLICNKLGPGPLSFEYRVLEEHSTSREVKSHRNTLDLLNPIIYTS